MGPKPQTFSTFQGAALKADELAKARGVTLFYIDSPNEPPYALRDYRRRS
jgi:hypothetical protein